MFKWYRRWKAKGDFEVYTRVWLQNNEDIVQYVLDDMKEGHTYEGIIDDLTQGDSVADITFGCVAIYVSKRLLPMAEHTDDLKVLEECIRDNSFENIPYAFWLIFHFLYLGVLHEEKGELSHRRFLFGRDKIIEFFVQRGMDYHTVQEFFIEGVLRYREIAREAVGKASSE